MGRSRGVAVLLAIALAPCASLSFGLAPARIASRPIITPRSCASGRTAATRAWPRTRTVPRLSADGATAAAPVASTGAATIVPVEKRAIKVWEPFGKGLRSDMTTFFARYGSDIKDGFSVKVLSTTGFLFFACLAPAVAFGGLMGVVTGGQIGSIEMITATSICGMVYALLSGQPLTIIGSTGPVLAFTNVLYTATARAGVPFLPVYGWVGLWTSALLAASSLFSVSNLVDYFTRFTDEIFSLLISVIFIYEAAKDIGGLFLNPTVAAANAALSLIVAVTTFNTAKSLNGLRPTRFLVKPMRELLADFAPTIGVVTGVFTGLWIKSRYALTLPTLSVPASFSTTIGRPWLVPLLSVPWSVRLACLVPALMSTVLLFMDQNITVRLVNSRKHKLKKGYGMHLDMLVISGLVAMCSCLGLPWLVAATVRSLAHVKSLANYKTEGGKEMIESMTENRVSGFAIHAAIGTSILLLRPVLGKVPLAVLMGLFLYLGTSSLKGNEMADRTALLVTDPAMRPQAPYIGKVPMKKTNLFTAIQLACLGAMMYIKGSKIGVLFPVIIALLAPLRIGLEKLKVFSPAELELLDGDSE